MTTPREPAGIVVKALETRPPMIITIPIMLATLLTSRGLGSPGAAFLVRQPSPTKRTMIPKTSNRIILASLSMQLFYIRVYTRRYFHKGHLEYLGSDVSYLVIYRERHG
jgi:hypothetical protein